MATEHRKRVFWEWIKGKRSSGRLPEQTTTSLQTTTSQLLSPLGMRLSCLCYLWGDAEKQANKTYQSKVLQCFTICDIISLGWQITLRHHTHFASGVDATYWLQRQARKEFTPRWRSFTPSTQGHPMFIRDSGYDLITLNPLTVLAIGS